MTETLINPLDETARPQAKPAPRLDSLEGVSIGLLDISKSGGDAYLGRLEQLLKEQYGVTRVVRATKPTFTKPAPGELIDQLVDDGCVAVIEALAD